jgi:hypothetical protein
VGKTGAHGGGRNASAPPPPPLPHHCHPACCSALVAPATDLPCSQQHAPVLVRPLIQLPADSDKRASGGGPQHAHTSLFGTTSRNMHENEAGTPRPCESAHSPPLQNRNNSGATFCGGFRVQRRPGACDTGGCRSQRRRQVGMPPPHPTIPRALVLLPAARIGSGGRGATAVLATGAKSCGGASESCTHLSLNPARKPPTGIPHTACGDSSATARLNVMPNIIEHTGVLSAGA